MQKKLFQLFVCAVIVLGLTAVTVPLGTLYPQAPVLSSDETGVFVFPKNKNRGQTPSVSCFIARYAKNYFFRTTSPPRPVCAVMYSRPILAYSNGLALAGSCSASTMIQPV